MVKLPGRLRIYSHSAIRCRRAFVVNQQAAASMRPQKKELTGEWAKINLSVSVDETISLRVVEGLARRRHGNRLRRDFNAQVPIPARTGIGVRGR